MRDSMPLQTLKYITAHPLNRHRRAAALLRFLKWQIGSRLVPGPVVYEWVAGARLLVKAGEHGVTGNVYCGLHDFSDMAYVLHATTAADLFVDVGANVGAYTVLACAARGARGRSYEPVPSTYRRLLENIRLNGLGSRVAAFNVGLSDGEGELDFTADENATNHVLAAGDARECAVKVRVSALDAALDGECPGLMKIDVEGFEARVIRGAHATLSNPILHSVVLELNGSGRRYGHDDSSILAGMRGYGFTPCLYEPFSRKLRIADKPLSASGNTLFVRDLARVTETIARAPRIAVGGIEL